MDDKDILSFLLSSKTFSLRLNNQDEIWKQMMSPKYDVYKKKSIKDEQYYSIWKKQATLKIKPGYLITQSDFSEDNILFNKKSDLGLVRQLILQDDPIGLVFEASRIGDFVSSMDAADKDSGIVVMSACNKSLEDIGQQPLLHGDFKFILHLMPDIIATHATQCFELLIQAYFFGLDCIGDADYGYTVRFDSLKEIIFKANDAWFVSKFIELVFKYSNNVVFLKGIILACEQYDVIHILPEAFNVIDQTTEKFISILNDDDLAHILRQCGFDNFFNERDCLNQLNNDYNRMKENFSQLHSRIEKELFENKLSPQALRELYDQSYQLGLEMITTKEKLNNFLCPHDAEKQAENNIRPSFS
jgi:hypothetical protein